MTASGSSLSLSAGLSSSWDLFTGFRRKAEWEGSAAQQESARASLTDQQRAVTFNVTAAYYEALRSGQVVEVASARIQRAEAGLEAAEKRGKVGAATRSDVLRARLELNSARTSELQARTNSAAPRSSSWAGWWETRGRGVPLPSPRPSPAPRPRIAPPWWRRCCRRCPG